MGVDVPDIAATTEPAGLGPETERGAAVPNAAAAVTALYELHAVGLIRLALVMLGDRPSAEDAVQDAFCALYRRWDRLADQDRALYYVRASVLNNCRSVLRRRIRASRRNASQGLVDAWSAESAVLVADEHRQVLDALRRLPRRQREALILRYYEDLPPAEVARSMNVSPGTVKSTTSRALAGLARMLREES
jgi:RNA polymerase sigma-70 factor (sigma-E family)